MAFRDLVCVVTLYGRTPKQSEALEGLRSFLENERMNGRVQDENAPLVVVYDNSPVPALLDLYEWGGLDVTYLHNPVNPGLAEAYNTALNAAASKGKNWLLLLDQDTRISTSFLERLSNQIDRAALSICAIVPRLRQGDVVLSPVVRGFFRESPVDTTFQGIHEGELMVLNSGACLRVAALLAIGGFPIDYPLDYLDHLVFFRLQKAGGRIQVLPDVLEHQLSLMNLRSDMSLSRYADMLSAEKRFVQESMGRRGRCLLRLRLLKRAWDQLIKVRSIKHAWLTLLSSMR